MKTPIRPPLKSTHLIWFLCASCSCSHWCDIWVSSLPKAILLNRNKKINSPWADQLDHVFSSLKGIQPYRKKQPGVSQLIIFLSKKVTPSVLRDCFDQPLPIVLSSFFPCEDSKCGIIWIHFISFFSMSRSHSIHNFFLILVIIKYVSIKAEDISIGLQIYVSTN